MNASTDIENAPPPPEAEKTPAEVRAEHPEEIVPLKSKIAWGTGGAFDNILTNGLGALSLPIYNIGLGVSPVFLGWAMALPRLVDALLDPLMGNLTDNTRSRWGRRRPWIFAGAILSGILFALVWMPPTALGKSGLGIYYVITASLLMVSYTMVAIPYNALGCELSYDYHERTRVMAWRIYFAYGGGMLIPWLYKLSQSDLFGGDPVVGVRYIGILAGAVILLSGILPSILCREKMEVQQQARIDLLAATKLTLTNKPFLLIVGTVILVILGLFLSTPFIMYVNIYYVAEGSKETGATYAGWYGTAQQALGFLSIPVITWLGKRFDKRSIMLAGTALAALGFLSTWFLLTPAAPYLQLLPLLLIMPGLSTVWLLAVSIIADICDLDELECGLRREGMFGAMYGFSFKIGISLVTVVSGYMLAWSGFNAEAAAQTAETLLRMRIAYIVVPTVLIGSASVLLFFFPVRRETILKARRELNARKERSKEQSDSLAHEK